MYLSNCLLKYYFCFHVFAVSAMRSIMIKSFLSNSVTSLRSLLSILNLHVRSLPQYYCDLIFGDSSSWYIFITPYLNAYLGKYVSLNSFIVILGSIEFNLWLYCAAYKLEMWLYLILYYLDNVLSFFIKLRTFFSVSVVILFQFITNNLKFFFNIEGVMSYYIFMIEKNKLIMNIT